jgi:peptidoglycan-associated lipoprotein
LLLLACAHAPPPAPPAAQQQPAAQAAPAPPQPAPAATEAAQKVTTPLAPASIYFEYDSSTLSSEARTTLQSFFEGLRARSGARLRIEGNCDERGTSEYNLALGQRRADSAKKYLVQLGAEAGRITAISNGKEKPRASGHDESAWRENRRDDLLPSNTTVGQLDR